MTEDCRRGMQKRDETCKRLLDAAEKAGYHLNPGMCPICKAGKERFERFI